MKLDRLEIHGFKSFADRTVVDFNPGLTAIVGPNGCGKTNITDAIRWVLGEQRPTALRGASMQEVIFNGTRERKPLGMCEVTLTFSNPFGLLPVEYAEVAVTRRVFRDGESEYFLNRVPCYLKDIRDLFMGTGVGSSAYSLIEGRMVDAILSDRADERRLLFEEAAGVTRYKARRRATLRKLEATESDLQRLQDILHEVRKTTGSLRRQVGKARRFAELQRRELRLAVAAAERELAELDGREGPLRERIQRLERDRERGTADRAAADAELDRLERALAQRRGVERDLRERLEVAAAELQEVERELARAAEGGRHATGEVERLSREADEHERQADELAARRRGLEASLDGARAAAGAARDEAGRASGETARLAAALDAAQAALREARAELDRLRAERLSAGETLAGALADRAAAEARRAEVEAALAELRPRGAAAGDALRLAQEEGRLAERVADLRAARARVEERAALRRAEREALERELDAAERELAELAARRREVGARLDTLEELREGFTGFGEGARHALEAGDRLALDLRGPLGVEVEVTDPRHAPAVEAYLDLFLDAVLAPGAHQARAVLEFWRERDQAGAVWPLADAAAGHAPELEPAVEERVLCRGTQAAALRGTLDRHRDALFGRLLIVEDLERALEVRRLLNRNGGAGWWVVAALSGEILEPSGIVRLPQRKEPNGRVARFHQAEALRAEIETLAGDLARAKAGADALRARLAAVVELEAADAAELGGSGPDLEAATRELERARASRSVAMDRAAELERELDATRERLERDAFAAREAEARAGAIRQELDDAVRRQAAAESAIEDVRAERDAALREESRLEVLAEQRAARLAALEREDLWLREAEGEQRRLSAEQRAESQTQREAAGAHARDVERLDVELARRREAAAAGRDERRRLEQAIGVLEAERAAADATARAVRAVHEDAGRELHVEEMRLADLLHRRESIRTIVETEFGRPLERLVEDARRPSAQVPSDEADEETAADPTGGVGEMDLPASGDAGTAPEAAGAPSALPPARRRRGGEELDEDLAALELPALRERLREVREKKTALGPVNLLALEEFATEKARLDFLDGQVADLERAREDLREAIRKINATARELFSRTFEAVQVNFRATFGTLFEGGTAEISLTDPADPLESDIEISASPRGKRVQAVNLLSGGERALTALSLLFAIYLVKPSPFCILDEVDAPLDDANIGRFLRMLKSFSDRTQFIVVTHNKRTMEAADFLYGVTMEEPGVSTLVSVDFERRRGFDAEALAARRVHPPREALVGD